ncbi:hypothetical protein [Fulvivirga ligni]|uniref:hypothetical protein n=1 Tax=Fulvivirga ligni TaxID=2904246 RepID=UPI001F467C85|nr:hypothetical protein [Fulvivirga ligni]UII21707.1 hypothetical protein LVD16_00450 [Fulvivirga ligni]
MKKLWLYLPFVYLCLLGCGKDEGEAKFASSNYDITLSVNSDVKYEFKGDEPRFLGKLFSGKSGVDKYSFQVLTGSDPSNIMVINFYMPSGETPFQEDMSYPLTYVDGITLNEVLQYGPVAELYFENTEGFTDGPSSTTVAYSGELETKIGGTYGFTVELGGHITDKVKLKHDIDGSVKFLETP